jgi:hypothetical protein
MNRLQRVGSLALIVNVLAWTSEAVATLAVPIRTESQKFLPADRQFYDNFGRSTAISGDVAMVGAPYGGTTLANSGSVYVYNRQIDGSWLQTSELAAADAFNGAYFGNAIAIEGNVAVIGSALGSGSVASGAAYVFERNGVGQWNQVAKLTPSNAAAGDIFGESVAINADRIVIGSTLGDGVTANTGAAYIFTRDSVGQWTESAKLMAGDGMTNDGFGISVAISGDTTIIGASGRRDGALGSTGAAYHFTQQPNGSWIESGVLTAASPNQSGQFGFDVSLDNGTLAIAAYRDRRANLTPGAVYLYEQQGNGWLQTQKIETDYIANDFGDFGRSVAVANDYLVIGAEDHNLESSWNGAAYVYRKSSMGQWLPDRVLLGSDSVDARFGNSVAVDGQAVFVGGYRREFEAGVAYAYSLVPEPVFGATQLGIVSVAILFRRRRARSLTSRGV